MPAPARKSPAKPAPATANKGAAKSATKSGSKTAASGPTKTPAGAGKTPASATKTAPSVTKTAATRPRADGDATTSPGGGDLAARFHEAAGAAKQTKKRPDNATLLKLYSYYKQATDGDVRGERPGGFDFVGAAKYDAWAKVKGMSRDEAMTQYIKQVERLNRE